MRLTRREVLGSAAAAASTAMLSARPARAQAPTIKLGVLTDLSGPYKDIGGPLATDCARLAVADFGAAAKGFNVEVIQADHQNKPDIGAGIARQWFDRDGVDVILDVPNSGVSLAVSGVAKEKNKIFLVSNAATSDLTGSKCTPTRSTGSTTPGCWRIRPAARCEVRRRQLVLHHRRLRVRPCASA